MGEGSSAFGRRTVLKSAGAGVLSSSIYSTTTAATGGGGGAETTTTTMPNIWLYDVSGREHTFDIQLRKHTTTGPEVTFHRHIDLGPREEQSFDDVFDELGIRHTARVRMDGTHQHIEDVTAVANHDGRYSLRVTSRPDSSISTSVVHLDPAEER